MHCSIFVPCNFIFLTLLSCCIYSVDFRLSLFIALLYILFLTGLFCLEDCFLSLSFSKVKEFSLVSFLALQSFSLSFALNSIFSRTSRFLSLSFNLMSGSSLVNFLALQSFSLSFALNSIFSRTSRFLSLSFNLILLSSLINFLALLSLSFSSTLEICIFSFLLHI